MLAWHNFESTSRNFFCLCRRKEHMENQLGEYGLIQNACILEVACTDFSGFNLCPVMKRTRHCSTETIPNITDFGTRRSTGKADSSVSFFVAIMSLLEKDDALIQFL